MRDKVPEQKKIKILYIVSSLVRSGPIVVLYNIIKNLDFEKFEPFILTFREEKLINMMDDFLKINGLTILYESIKIPFCKNKINKILEKIEPNIVHSNGLSADFINMASSKNGQMKITTLHNTLYGHYSYIWGVRGNFVSYFHHFILLHMDKIIACSENVEKNLKKNKFESVKILNGITPNYVNTNKVMSKINFQLNKRQTIIFVGSIDYRKNVQRMINAFKASIASEKYDLLIVGDGDLKYALENKNKKNASVYFCGFVDNPIELIRNSKFLILPSYYEALPVVILESLSQGVPVLLSDIPPHRSIFKLSDKNIGILFELSNQKMVEMFNKLNTLEIADKIKENCQELYNKYFTGELMSCNYMKLYNSILIHDK